MDEGNKKIIKILYVNGGPMDHGGITSYMMNFYRHFSLPFMHIDFLTQGERGNLYEDEIKKNGGTIYRIPNKSVNIGKNIIGLYRIMKAGKYDIVHAHADAGNAVILAVAKISGVPVRISHSHSTNFYTKSKIKRIANNIQRKMIKKYATSFWGCSEDACKWLYTEQAQYEIIHNAVDISKYKFNNNRRKAIREQLDISDDVLAICQVGHLNYIKNQEYTIQVLKILKNKTPKMKFKMFFIGDGEDRERLARMVFQNNLSENIIFLGRRDDVDQILQGMDIFLLPSKFEGFPVSLVESQTSGVFSIVSSNITHEVCLNKEFLKYLPITDDSVNEWVSELQTKHTSNRESAYLIAESAGFDIETEAKRVQTMYEELVENY